MRSDVAPSEWILDIMMSDDPDLQRRIIGPAFAFVEITESHKAVKHSYQWDGKNYILIDLEYGKAISNFVIASRSTLTGRINTLYSHYGYDFPLKARITDNEFILGGISPADDFHLFKMDVG